jgi:hypothetical protein
LLLQSEASDDVKPGRLTNSKLFHGPSLLNQFKLVFLETELLECFGIPFLGGFNDIGKEFVFDLCEDLGRLGLLSAMAFGHFFGFRHPEYPAVNGSWCDCIRVILTTAEQKARAAIADSSYRKHYYQTTLTPGVSRGGSGAYTISEMPVSRSLRDLERCPSCYSPFPE